MAFWYFGYGSNMDLTSLRAKGVEPRSSMRALLSGWRLRFNVGHFFRHEGGVGNIEPSADAADRVCGVLHLCEDAHLAPLDAAEACGHGYDRIEVTVQTERGPQPACTYVGTPSFIDDSCLPTRRYLNIVLKGAAAAGLDAAYVDTLKRQPVLPPLTVPPYVPPDTAVPTYDATDLAAQPLLTALAGWVFDMSGARPKHEFLKSLFGGRDMTLFHLKRMDASDGSETLADIAHGRLSPAQRQYLDQYLHAYDAEYRCCGRYRYPDPAQVSATMLIAGDPRSRYPVPPSTAGALHMDAFPEALPHGELEEVFPGVYFVTGTMKTVLMGAHWHFSRNMTVVRDGDALTLINSVRLDDGGLARLDTLGKVAHVVRIGSLHGRDDAYYKARYGATLWALPGMQHEHGLVADRELVAGGAMPFAGCTMFEFRSTKLPECILRIDRTGGILVACDSLQNWIAPDAYFSDESRETMGTMGFFQKANLGPVWQQVNEPKAEDFRRLEQLDFRHALCGHGEPLRDTAHEDFSARFAKVFPT